MGRIFTTGGTGTTTMACSIVVVGVDSWEQMRHAHDSRSVRNRIQQAMSRYCETYCGISMKVIVYHGFGLLDV